MRIRTYSTAARGAGLAALLVALCAGAPAAWAQAGAADDDIFAAEDMPGGGFDPELLLFQEIPTVTLATKRAQPITLAPASISVITAEDIRRQGARSITDLLRNVPGINVQRITNSDINVAARFPADNNNAEMLVLIDGRTVYLDFFGNVIWDALPVVIEDIARIEIIRGPASPLYGANAYAGIVNIITKTPEEHAANTLSGSIGTQDRYVTTYIHSGSQGKWRYKAVASWDEINEFEDSDDNARENLKLYTTHYYDFAEDERLRLSVGVDDSDGDTRTGLGNFSREQQQAYIQAVLNYEAWEVQMFFNHFNGHVSNPIIDPFPGGGLIINPRTGVPIAVPFNPQGRSQIDNNVFNVEFQHTLELLDAHKITWGAGYRFNEIRSDNIFRGDENLDIFNVFVQDEWAVTDDLTVTGSVRVDHRQLTNATVSPRLAAVYEWRPGRVFRVSVSQAFRDPTHVENFIDIAGAQVVGGLPFPLGIIATGNRNLDPMEITTFEVGYRGRYYDDTLNVSLDVFYNELDEIIEFMSPSPGLFTFGNIGGVDQAGGEIEVEYYWRQWLQPYVNYSLLVSRAQNDGVLGAQQIRGHKVKSAPQHKVNAGIFADWNNGWSAMAQMHWVDQVPEDALNPFPPPSSVVVELGDYTRVDARLGYHIDDPDLEISVAVFNAFGDRHREFPLGEPLLRQVVLNVLWKF